MKSRASSALTDFQRFFSFLISRARYERKKIGLDTMQEERHLLQQNLRGGQLSTQAEVHCKGEPCPVTGSSVGGMRM